MEERYHVSFDIFGTSECDCFFSCSSSFSRLFILFSLMPHNDRSAWGLPIALFVVFIIFLIILITFIVLGYETIDYDEVKNDDSFSLIFVFDRFI